MTATFKDTLQDIKAYRELLEEKATESVLEDIKPKIKAYVDARILSESSTGLSEQQSVMGPGGFPYQGETVGVDASTLSSAEANSSVPQPSVSVDSVAMPQAGSVPTSDASGVGIVLDLDAIEAEAEAAAALPEVPVIDEFAPEGGAPSQAEIASSVEGDPSAVAVDGEQFDDDLVQIIEPEDLVGNKQDSELEIEFEDDDDEEDDFITISPTDEGASLPLRLSRRIRNEAVGAVSPAAVRSHLSRVESLYTKLVESDEILVRIGQLDKIQETLGENQTLRDAVKQALSAGTVKADEFKGIYEVSLAIDKDLRSMLSIYESTEIDLVNDEASNTLFEMDDVIDHYGGGQIASAKTVKQNPQTGPMKADEKVYELDMAEEDSVTPESSVPDDNLLEDIQQMSRKKDGYVEIDRDELQEALKRLARRRRVSEAAQAEAGDPGTPPEPSTKSALGVSDAYGELDLSDSMVPEDGEVEADEYAATSDGSKRPPAMESLRKRVAKLRREVRTKDAALAEAKLVNRKLMHAFKLLNMGGLTNGQKKSISESLKRAKTVDQADFVFETFKKQIEGSAATAVNEGRVRAGASSRVTPSGSPKKTLAEGAGRDGNQFARWNQLAGMSK